MHGTYTERHSIWRASTRRGVCMRAYAPPLVRGVLRASTTHTCNGTRVAVSVLGTQTKGGKPVSSGAPERREQPFYSIPGGKRLALSLRRRRQPRRCRRRRHSASRRDNATRDRYTGSIQPELYRRQRSFRRIRVRRRCAACTCITLTREI